MQQLTKEQGERCYKACYGSAAVGVLAGSELDPYFWFPRLWERLQAVANGRSINYYCRGLPSCREYDILMGSQWLCDTTRDICEALCAAIEALEKEK